MLLYVSGFWMGEWVVWEMVGSRRERKLIVRYAMAGMDEAQRVRELGRAERGGVG